MHPTNATAQSYNSQLGDVMRQPMIRGGATFFYAKKPVEAVAAA